MKALKTAVIAFAAALLSVSGAAAGDFSTFQSIGFSKDGKVYAFEEYGVQDGSGFPYSSIYFIDTEKDAYLPGTPIRVRIDDEQAGLSTARAQALAKAGPMIEEHGLLDNPGILAAFNPMGQLGVDRNRIEYYPYAIEPMPGGSYAMALDEIHPPLTEKCRDITPHGGKGFRLRFVQTDGTPVDRTVYEDRSMPDSRNCVLSYQISGALTFHPPSGKRLHMALVLVRSVGFEGANGRWIAVPVRP